MLRALSAAAGTFVLAAAVLVPSGPALADDIRDQQWYLKSLKVSEAHAISTGSGVTVAIIDSGVSAHRDFNGNLLAGYNFATAKPDGRTDTEGHGTNMAGLIAARGRGSSGVLGIAPSAKILPLKGGKEDDFSSDIIAQAIDYAVAHKVQVINASLKGAPSIKLLKAVKDANAAGVVVVGASGNDGDTLVGYPAAADGALGVGATDKNGKPWADSTHGPTLQICAPGVDIITTGKGNKYTIADGTSDSAAIVSGAVALVRAKFPQLSADEIIHRITATADDNGTPGRDDYCGYGELNIVKALTADVPPLNGDTAASASASLSATAATPTSDNAAAPPNVEKKSSSTPLIVGVVVVVLLVAGLVGFAAVRRRGGHSRN
jgi:type VII secretion-associated serine protease mycosin